GVGANPVYGQYVVAQGADGLSRIYGHLSTATVSKGQYVPRGSILGHVGSSGRSTGPHVHYEILGSGGPTGVSGFYPYA
ncbi:M23 family metallopeptidase, partial [Listeria monocytogenes]|uniref:M23 family metallopeptidase n=1 Tax=Listeria monocytogenes TaxID=1639 RepID=UPI002FDBA516